MSTENVREVKEVLTEEEANTLLKEGWVILTIFSFRRTLELGGQYREFDHVMYILGRQ